jgi:hypothetical protein
MLDARELVGVLASATSVPVTASRRIGVELTFIGAPPVAV